VVKEKPVKYHFVEERTVMERAVFTVDADNLETACYAFVRRRTDGDPPDEADGDILDFEVVRVEDENGDDSHLDQARDYIEDAYDAWTPPGRKEETGRTAELAAIMRGEPPHVEEKNNP
jgi:hypothetical protein